MGFHGFPWVPRGFSLGFLGFGWDGARFLEVGWVFEAVLLGGSPSLVGSEAVWP